MWKGVEVMKFKVGDKVVFKNDAYGILSFVVESWSKNVKTQKYKYYVNDDWHEEDELEPITDPLATKIEERNNKPSIREQLEDNLLELLDEDDKVNSPSHYTKGDIEVIDIIKQLTQGYEPFEAYLVGNTIKYLARANFKENKQQDLEKAEWHINKLLEEEE